jgi:starvation-inducible DNA-binding protein
MNELIQALRKTLASNFALYLKTQMFHWNVEGPNFSEYHEFWATIYSDLYEQSDVLAEFIRQANEYAPGSLSVYSEISSIEDEEGFPNAQEMFSRFLSNNDVMITLYNQLYAAAEKAEQYQISDFCAQRLAAHRKHAWMTRSYLKA